MVTKKMLEEEKKIESSAKFDVKIFSVKVLKQCLYVFIVGLASVYADNNFYLMALPLITAIENYIKHSQ
jgi:hypothetical protein